METDTRIDALEAAALDANFGMEELIAKLEKVQESIANGAYATGCGTFLAVPELFEEVSAAMKRLRRKQKVGA